MTIYTIDNKNTAKKFNFWRIVVFLTFIIFSSQALTACAIRSSGYGGQIESSNIGVGSNSKTTQIAPQIVADSHALAVELNHLPTKAVKNKHWQNPDTGSSGVLSAFAEEPVNTGEICRKFQTTRESYDGSALYQGKTCKYHNTDWVLQSIEEK